MKVYLIAFLFSTFLSLILGFIAIPLLKKLNFSQTILKYVEEHNGKNGTPTMGGLFFILASIIIFFLFAKGNKHTAIVAITITLGFLLVGFIDDYIKIKFRHNEGLTPIQKFSFQIIVACIASLFAYKNGFDFAYIPFIKKTAYFGIFSIILNIFIFLATVNSVNLTDGLDGLCAGVCLVDFIVIAVVVSLQLTFNKDNYILVDEYKNLILLSIALAGSLFGYLVFNVQKASVFMGDTGSLALGGAIASISVFSGNILYIPIICITFVISTLSVIIQVLYYKRTKKRVFLMAPLHHHFQHKGFNESKISFSYFFVTVLIGVLVIICLI